MPPFPREDYKALTRYSPDRRPVDVDLSDNTNLWGTHPDALARIQACSTDDLARYPDLYADALKTAVSDRLGVRAECVATGCGSADVLDSIFRAVRTSDQSFISVATPTFSLVIPMARMNGMEAREVTWPEALATPEALLEGGPALVYVCRPNNPTGHMAPTAWLESLIEAAGPDGPLILVDEAYIDFSGGSFVQLPMFEPRVIVTRTMSKAFGLAGMRVGYAVASPDTTLEIEKSRGPYKVGRMAAEAAAAALRDSEGWVQRTVSECLENRDRLRAALLEHGLEPDRSFTNFILFRAPSGDASKDALALRTRGVAVRPFSGIPNMGDGLRVTVGPWPLMDRFLEALDGVRTQ